MVKIVILAGLLGAVFMTSDAFAWSSSKSGHGGSGASGQVFNNGNDSANSNDSVSVPEPSSLYALGTALALVGATGWVLRRRK